MSESNIHQTEYFPEPELTEEAAAYRNYLHDTHKAGVSLDIGPENACKYKAVGMARSIEGKAGFSPAPMVLQHDQVDWLLLKEVKQVSPQELIANIVPNEDANEVLIPAGHMTKFPPHFPQITYQSGMKLWVIRSNNPLREQIKAEIVDQNHPAFIEFAPFDENSEDSAWALFVNEDKSPKLRNEWAKKAYDQCRKLLAEGKKEEAVNYAGTAFCMCDPAKSEYPAPSALIALFDHLAPARGYLRIAYNTNTNPEYHQSITAIMARAALQGWENIEYDDTL